MCIRDRGSHCAIVLKKKKFDAVLSGQRKSQTQQLLETPDCFEAVNLVLIPSLSFSTSVSAKTFTTEKRKIKTISIMKITIGYRYASGN